LRHGAAPIDDNYLDDLREKLAKIAGFGNHNLSPYVLMAEAPRNR